LLLGYSSRSNSDEEEESSLLNNELLRQQANRKLIYSKKTLQRLISLEHTTISINKRLLAEAGFEYKGIIYCLIYVLLKSFNYFIFFRF